MTYLPELPVSQKLVIVTFSQKLEFVQGQFTCGDVPTSFSPAANDQIMVPWVFMSEAHAINI